MALAAELARATGASRRKRRVLVVNNVPAPFLMPVLKRLRATPGWDLWVAFSHRAAPTTGWDAGDLDLPDEKWITFLDGSGNAPLGRCGDAAVAQRLARELRRARPEAILSYGYTGVAQLTVLLWAMLTKTPYAVTGDCNVFIEAKKPARDRFLRRKWLLAVVHNASALIALGTASRRFWESKGAAPDRIVTSCFAVNNDFFEARSKERAEEAARLREALGFSEKVVFIYVGRLVARKNVRQLIQAVQQVEGAALLVVGDGPERQAVERLARGSGNAVVVGRIRHNQLPLYYAAADVLVLPASDEPWGLVINEAMASGLAVVADKHCGAAVDLVSRENGILMDSCDVASLTAVVRGIVDRRGQLPAMKAASLAAIRGWTFERAVTGIRQALEKALSGRESRRSSAVGV